MKLKFSFSAICRLEELEKQPASKVFVSLQKGNFSFLALRSIYAAARTTDKPDITVEEAEKEIDELINKKGITEVVELLTEALTESSILEKYKKKMSQNQDFSKIY